jgi:hypothetical protein
MSEKVEKEPAKPKQNEEKKRDVQKVTLNIKVSIPALGQNGVGKDKVSLTLQEDTEISKLIKKAIFKQMFAHLDRNDRDYKQNKKKIQNQVADHEYRIMYFPPQDAKLKGPKDDTGYEKIDKQYGRMLLSDRLISDFSEHNLGPSSDLRVTLLKAPLGERYARSSAAFAFAAHHKDENGVDLYFYNTGSNWGKILTCLFSLWTFFGLLFYFLLALASRGGIEALNGFLIFFAICLLIVIAGVVHGYLAWKKQAEADAEEERRLKRQASESN